MLSLPYCNRLDFLTWYYKLFHQALFLSTMVSSLQTIHSTTWRGIQCSQTIHPRQQHSRWRYRSNLYLIGFRPDWFWYISIQNAILLSTIRKLVVIEYQRQTIGQICNTFHTDSCHFEWARWKCHYQEWKRRVCYLFQRRVWGSFVLLYIVIRQQHSSANKQSHICIINVVLISHITSQ